MQGKTFISLPIQPQPTSAYVHVPFCQQRCPYCNFTVVANRGDWMERYVDCVTDELSRLGSSRAMQTLFIGGGTPTLLPPNLMQRLFDSIHQWLPLDVDGGELTIEANPNDITDELCKLLRDNGVNRISVGGQSFNNSKLATLGRDHQGAGLRTVIQFASEWFDEVSVDLIFGAPGESIDSWMGDLDIVTALPVTHVSTYGLTYEKGARYWSQLQRGEIMAAAEDIELRMYLGAIERLTSAGFEHYEVSNFSLPGSACRHNETYWQGEPWYAFGPGAASFVDGVRRVNHRSTSTYLKRIEARESPVAEEDRLDWPTWTRERFVFGMRKLSGIEWDLLQVVGEPGTLMSIKEQISRHQDRGWLEWDGAKIRMTGQALPISDGLWKDYL